MNSQFTHRTGRADSSHFHCQQVPFLCIIDFASVINTWGPLLPVFLQVRAARSFQDNSVGCAWFLHQAVRRGVHWLPDKDVLNGFRCRPMLLVSQVMVLRSKDPKSCMAAWIDWKPTEQSSSLHAVYKKMERYRKPYNYVEDSNCTFTNITTNYVS